MIDHNAFVQELANDGGNNSKVKHPKAKIFPPLLRLTLLLILLQCWVISQTLTFSQGIFPLKDFFFEHVIHSTVALEQITVFLLWQVLAYGLLILMIYTTARVLGRFFKLSNKTQQNLAIIIWLITFTAIYLANVFYFPHSEFAQIKHFIFSDNIKLAHRIFMTSLISLGIIIGFLSLVFWRISAPIILVAAIIYYYPIHLIPHQRSAKQPNIIILGIDSLRPDHIALTPAIRHFVAEGQIYPHAYTPLARTFPAWVSILTGKYPSEHGARFNLTEKSQVDIQSTIAKSLQDNGYESVFITDERRFSNIDRDYGFDKIIGPQQGVNDFLLGSINDFPLTNLLLNAPIGSDLFGFTGYNRAAAKNYNPNRFTRHVINFINKPHAKPLFLAIHLCLPHWPYTWADSTELDQAVAQTPHENYNAALKKVDMQFQAIVKSLEKRGLLDNALVFVISDHGDGFGELGDRLTQEQFYTSYGTPPKRLTHLSGSYGHGTDILSPSQFQVLFAMKNYGENPLPQGINETPVSLVDIAPTIADYLNLPNQSGVSLLRQINPNRSIFIETGLTSRILNTQHPELKELLSETIRFYDIDTNNSYIFLKPEATNYLITQKQKAVIQYPWFYATITNTDSHQDSVLANLYTGQWSHGEDSSLAWQAPLRQLKHSIHLMH